MTENTFTFNRSDFPADFVFGTATSAYQIEGSSFGKCGSCHWDDFARTPGNVVGGTDGKLACNHYNLWEQDLDYVKNCNLDAYRFSTSWARILPNGVGQVNQEGLDFYDRLVDGLLTRNLKPFLSLYHWELPSPLNDLGGWRNADISDWFAEYTAVVVSRLGDRLESVATFNEPWCVSWLSHFLGHHAPGLRDIRAAARAMHHILVAHGKSITVMREHKLDKLGIVLNFEYSQPVNETAQSVAAAQRYDGIYNRWFLGGLFKKQYPEDIVSELGPYLPLGWEKDFDLIAEPMDWLGINYYTRKLIDNDPSTSFPSLTEVPGPLPKTAMDWEIYPQGLYSLIDRIHKEYTGDLPLYITENGLALDDVLLDGEVNDNNRIQFVDDHLISVRKAIAEGAPVKGYFLWSLLDNYEWAFGYEKRFGMVHVDFETFERTPKQSYKQFAQVLR